MSGIGFQKRYGDKTIGNLTLEAITKPDLYKMARMFAPEMELIAITKTWEIPLNNRGDTGVSFEGRFFGIFELHLTSTRTGDSNTNYRRSVGKLHDDFDLVAQTSIIIHGNDTLVWCSDHAKHTGFATGMSLTTHGSNPTDHGMSVTFIGFRLGEAPLPKIAYDTDYNLAYANSSTQIAHLLLPGSGFIEKPAIKWYFIPKGVDESTYVKVLFDGVFAYFIQLDPSEVITEGFNLSPYWDSVAQANFPLFSCSVKSCEPYKIRFDSPNCKFYTNDIIDIIHNFSVNASFYTSYQVPPSPPIESNQTGFNVSIFPEQQIFEYTVFDISIQSCRLRFEIRKIDFPIIPSSVIIKRNGIVQLHTFLQTSDTYWIYDVAYDNGSDIDMQNFDLFITT